MTATSPARTDSTLASYTKLRVSVSSGPDTGISTELSYLPLYLGASSDGALVLSEPSRAPHHCALESVAGGVRIRDDGSDGGVFLGELRIFDGVAPLPATISLGKARILVESLSEPVTRARSPHDSFGDLLGRSARMRELFAELAAIAQLDGSVLIEAERGTGRQLVAESIHDASARRDGPFVVIDCSNLVKAPTTSDLFGHERGAVAGASEARSGAFEQAHSGDLYLHEVGALPHALQLEIERVLASGEVLRQGARRGIPVDVRLLTSSRKNLDSEARLGSFRRELLVGLAQSHVRIPSLRDRLEDLPLLVEHFLRRTQGADLADELPASIWHLLSAYRWPGNVRELLGVVRGLTLGHAGPGQPKPASVVATDAPAGAAPPVALQPLRLARSTARDNFEQDYLRALLARTQGNVTRAAAIAEVSRQMMQKLLRKYRAE